MFSIWRQAWNFTPSIRSLAPFSRQPMSKNFNCRKHPRISEPPGQGLRAIVAGREVQITNREKFLKQNDAAASQLPSVGSGLECIVLIDGRYAATYRFRDAPRAEGLSFVKHLGPKH